ncbi:MAG TPA: GNAT family protein [Bellilinea sp.]|nr:GNAT family protein [Bellilinea sp.]
MSNLTGKLVRLVIEDLEESSKLMSSWDHDSEYLRLLSFGPVTRYNAKATQEFFEKESGDELGFGIQTIADGKSVGFIGLNQINPLTRNAMVGMGIGERENWSKGYGTEAMKLVLNFAFEQLNLNRVTLDVFEVNQRGIRAYEKAGFLLEGRIKQALMKAGTRYDLILMGITRRRWDEIQSGKIKQESL